MEHHVVAVYVSDPQSVDVTGHIGISPDQIVDSRHDRFGIDEARRLADTAWQTPSVGVIQTLVVRASFVTIEAQNALLKLFEEPPATTQIVLVIPEGFMLLDTVLSRVQTVNIQDTSESQPWAAFVSASYKDRLSTIESELKQKDSTWLQSMQTGLRQWVGAGGVPTPSVQLVVERLGTRGASNKMLLELLALELPQARN